MNKRTAIITHVMIDTGDGSNRSVISQEGEFVLLPTQLTKLLTAMRYMVQ